MQPQSSANGLAAPYWISGTFPSHGISRKCTHPGRLSTCVLLRFYICAPSLWWHCSHQGFLQRAGSYARRLEILSQIIRVLCCFSNICQGSPACGQDSPSLYKTIYFIILTSGMSLGSYNLRKLVNCIFPSQFAGTGEMAQQGRIGGHSSAVTVPHFQESFGFSFFALSFVVSEARNQTHFCASSLKSWV